MKKRDDNIYVQICGGQSERVTGSCTSVSYMTNQGRRHLLVDLGIVQGGSVWDEYIENKQLLDNIPIKYAEYVFLTHNHADHVGNIPALNSRGFKGDIIITDINKKFLERNNMLHDSTKIHVNNCMWLKSKGKKAKELYNLQDMYSVVDMMKTYTMNEIYKLDDNVSFRYCDNSHIIGATQLELFITKMNGVIKKIVFTGDLGNNDNFEYNYFAKPTKQITKCDLLLIESTYGKGDRNFNKKDCLNEREDLKKAISEFVVDNKQSLLIPVFSLARLQNMMCWLYDTYKDNWNLNTPILVDTNLGNKINEVYSKVLEGEDLEYWNKVLNWKAFKFIKDYKSSIAFLTSKQKGLILSASGMLSGGRSVLHAKQILGNSKGCICFCGYCSPNSLGGQVLDESVDKVDIEGSVMLKRCTIKRYRTFSSHASQKDLINYIKQCNCNNVVLMHGEEEAKEELKRKSVEVLSDMNRTTKVHISKKDLIISL